MKEFTIHNIPDFKNQDGSWGKSYLNVVDGIPFRMRSRASLLWGSMTQRCRSGSGSQMSRINYTGCENNFQDYQSFTEWCQTQYGYMNKEHNGHFWCLDKDILVYGNKVYSPETCLFVPLTVNTVMVGSDLTRGSLPIGVRSVERVHTIKYSAKCARREGSSYLGLYSTSEEAHAAWQKAKIERLWEEALEVEDHVKLYNALMLHIDRIRNDYENGRETKVEWWTDRGLTIQ